MPTRNVSLTDHFDQFIEAGVASGRFDNASEAVGEGLSLLEQREREDNAKLEWLRAAAKEAFDSLDRGEGIAINSDEELDAFFDRIHEEVEAELAGKRKSA